MCYLKYLKYVFLHKWYVFLECYKRGLYWRGLVHDLSKFLPSEFIPYAKFFYRRCTVRDDSGYYKPTDTGDPKFDFAWLLHQKRNDHHWQWWVLPLDDGGTKVIPMSKKARLEMFCDWLGAGRAQKTKGVKYWYAKNKDKLVLHRETRAYIESEILKLSL